MPKEVLERRRRRQPPHQSHPQDGILRQPKDLSLRTHENGDHENRDDGDLDERPGEDWTQDDIFCRKENVLARRSSLCRVKHILRSDETFQGSKT